MGRDREIAQLEGCLEGGATGAPQLRQIVGEAGIGKTRLAEELASRAAARGFEILWGRCHEEADCPSWWPWTEAVRRWLESHTNEEVRAALPTDRAGRAALATLVPGLAARCGIRGRSARDRSARDRYRLLGLFTDVFRAIGAQRPLLVVIDDLQWADEASIALLRFVAREAHPARLVVVATVRVGEPGRSGDIVAVLDELLPRMPRIELHGLRPNETKCLVERHAPPDLEGAVDRIHRLTGGNPLFVAELLRLLPPGFDRAELEGLGPLPGVRATAGRRIGRLSEPGRALLCCAAVAGEETSLTLIVRATSLESGVARRALGECVDAGLLFDAGAGGIRFVHDLVRQAAYDQLHAEERRARHLLLAAALEADTALVRGSREHALARHYLAAASEPATGPSDEVVGRAVEWSRRAAASASSAYAFADAAALLERAILLLDPRVEPARSAELWVELGEARARTGDKSAARDAFVRAASLARASGSVETLARAAFGHAGHWVRLVPRSDLASVTLLEEALTAITGHELALTARIEARLAAELVAPSDQDRRRRLSASAVRHARRAGDPAALAFTLNVRRLVQAEPGETRRRIGHAREVIRIARARRDDELAAEGHGALARDLLDAGDGHAMDAAIDEQARLAERLRIPALSWQVALRRAAQAHLRGRLVEAEELIGAALRTGEAAQVESPLFITMLQLVLVRREQGRLAELQLLLQRAIEGTSGLPTTPYWLPFLHMGLGERDEARVTFEEIAARDFADVPIGFDRLVSLSFAAEVCAWLRDRSRASVLYDLLRPYAGHCVTLANGLGLVDVVDRPLGLLAATRGRLRQAETHLDASIAAFRRLHAPARLARARADLALVLRLAPGRSQRRVDELIDAARGEALRLGLAGVLADLPAPGLAAPQTSPTGGVPGRERLPHTKGDGVAVGERPTGIFRREGDHWHLALGTSAIRLRDSKGLVQIHNLLGRPDEDVFVLDLVDRRAGEGPSEPFVDPDLHAVHRRRTLGDAGALIDDQSTRSYRARIDELRAVLAGAREGGDQAAAVAAQEEIEALVVELRRGVGLGNRARRGSSHLERARVSVTRTIRDAIRRVARQDESLGDYLDRSVRTGRLCSYRPPPVGAVDWKL